MQKNEVEEEEVIRGSNKHIPKLHFQEKKL